MALESGNMLQIGEVIKPTVSEDSVREIIQQEFGLKVLTITELNSYDDRNYYVTVENKYANSHIVELHPDGYVLKVLNSMDSRRPAYVEAMNALIMHVTNHGFPTTNPVPSVNGKLMVLRDIPVAQKESSDTNTPKKRHVIRLFTFLRGTILLRVPFTPSICHSVGKYAGRLDNTLKTFHHVFYDSHATMWSLDNLPKLRDFLYFVSSETDRELVNEIVTTFESEVIPLLGKFQKGMIHNDLNEGNILMDLDTSSDSTNRTEKDDCQVCGVIDFGDSMLSYFVFEVAVAMCYTMIQSQAVHPFDAAGHLLAGYVSEVRLNETERSCLKTCVAGRFCQSLVLGAYSYSIDPTNEYLLSTAKRGWSCLREFWSEPREKLETRWNIIISSYATNATLA